jgi:hypothetical protein
LLHLVQENRLPAPKKQTQFKPNAWNAHKQLSYCRLHHNVRRQAGKNKPKQTQFIIHLSWPIVVGLSAVFYRPVCLVEVIQTCVSNARKNALYDCRNGWSCPRDRLQIAGQWITIAPAGIATGTIRLRRRKMRYEEVPYDAASIKVNRSLLEYSHTSKKKGQWFRERTHCFAGIAFLNA